MLLASILSKSLAVKLALGVAGLSLGATTVAAEAGALPAPVQAAAHDLAGDLGVPAPVPHGIPGHRQLPAVATSAAPSPSPARRDHPGPDERRSAEPTQSPEVHDQADDHTPEAGDLPEAQHSEPATSEHDGEGTTAPSTPGPVHHEDSSGSGGGSHSGSDGSSNGGSDSGSRSGSDGGSGSGDHGGD
jgi:uncharacterized membrane protein YgcG